MLPFEPCPPTPNCYIAYIDVPLTTEEIALITKERLLQCGAYNIHTVEDGFDADIDIFMFTDDLKIRFMYENKVTRLWIRSSSRVGYWDLGVNRFRVCKLMGLLKKDFKSGPG